MNKQIKQILITAYIFIGLVLINQDTLVFGQEPYGKVEPSIDIYVDKDVFDPRTNEYVANLPLGTYHFSPGEEVKFRVRIKNTGETTFANVKVTDYLPSYVELISGSTQVEYDQLEPDQEKSFEITVKVLSADKIPNEQTILCVINKAKLEADGQSDEDEAQICIEKKVLGVEVQPEAGSHLLVLSLIPLTLSSLGFILARKVRMVS